MKQYIIDELKNKFFKAVERFSVITVTMEAENLDREYVAQGIFPEKYLDDAIHIAVSINAGVFTIISDDDDFDTVSEINRVSLE